MSYPFRTTTKVDNDTYLEDRGCPHEVKRGTEDFAAVDAQFGSMLNAGQTAVKSMDGEGFDVVDGCPMLEEAQARNFASLRKARDAKLAATDYMLAADYPIAEDKLTTVKAYRQALRDLPAVEGAPWDGGGSATPWPVM
ncbi:MAG: phage tail assembly chaperone [Desulfovibrio sp.]|nr:phage tail assembly chaperone [Desulfovibrio sp.]